MNFIIFIKRLKITNDNCFNFHVFLASFVKFNFQPKNEEITTTLLEGKCIIQNLSDTMPIPTRY